MEKQHLKNIITDQRESLQEQFKTEKIVLREGLERCKQYLNAPNILLISGMRRAGKSFFSHLLVGGHKYAFINFDDERLIGLKTKDLNTILESFYELYDGFEFIILDEVQNVKGWELFVNRLRNKYRIIITGSNANLLSAELATHLTGRFISFNIFPLSFKEFLRFNSFDPGENSTHSTRVRSQLSVLFSKYLAEGGIFDYYKFGKEFTRNLFNSVITKDIVVRYRVKYANALEELALLLVNYFTSKISLRNLSRHLNIKSSHTVKEYLNYLENSFLIFSISRFSYKIKEQTSTFKKIYVSDNGIINSLSFNFSENRGKLLENLVAVELKRKSILEDFEIFYWDNPNAECDFIIKKGRKIVSALQVSSEINLQNRKREVSGLLRALKEFRLKEGTIITESSEEEISENGFKIKVIPAWKWLLT
ncbi:MAG: ATP-binding protein [Candidatus Omnitrophota bacterium]